jgi:hypothetical protein
MISGSHLNSFTLLARDGTTVYEGVMPRRDLWPGAIAWRGRLFTMLEAGAGNVCYRETSLWVLPSEAVPPRPGTPVVVNLPYLTPADPAQAEAEPDDQAG